MVDSVYQVPGPVQGDDTVLVPPEDRFRNAAIRRSSSSSQAPGHIGPQASSTGWGLLHIQVPGSVVVSPHSMREFAGPFNHGTELKYLSLRFII